MQNPLVLESYLVALVGAFAQGNLGELEVRRCHLQVLDGVDLGLPGAAFRALELGDKLVGGGLLRLLLEFPGAGVLFPPLADTHLRMPLAPGNTWNS